MGNAPIGNDSDNSDLSKRRDRLEERLARKRPTDPNTGSDRAGEQAKGFSQAIRLSSEFVAGIVVGSAIGWLVDRVAGTSPWGLIVFLLLGFVAGVFNVLRAAGRMAEPDDKGKNG